MYNPSQSLNFLHVEDQWDEAVADRLDGLGRLVYRSNLLGSDRRFTNTGGGNTSSKIMERDPVTGEEVEVLWVKGSGGDLGTAGRENFSSLYQQKLLALQEAYARFPDRGLKTQAEDAMPAMYAHAVFNLNRRAPSIDTPLHGFVPYRHVDHMHPVAAIAIATADNGAELTREAYGDEVVWVDWKRPGFELGLDMQRVCKEYPEAKGVMLGGHGLINWADDDRECYLLTLRLMDRAEQFVAEHTAGNTPFGGARYESLSEVERRAVLADLLPWLRGRLGRDRKVIATVDTSKEVLEFVNSREAPRLAELGTSCPDHFLRTKIKPLYVDRHPLDRGPGTFRDHIDEALAGYADDYAAYYEACRHPDSPEMRSALPSVLLLPGLGMIGWGKNRRESGLAAEFYAAAIHVMRGAEAIGAYTALPRQEAFDIEYWALEEAKLQRMPPEKELAREVAVVVGGGSGIGAAVAQRLADEGAVVAVVDMDESAARATAQEMMRCTGADHVLALGADITDRASVCSALNQVVLACGGIDHVVVTAGLYPTPDSGGDIPDEAWTQAFDVNVTGSWIVADEAARIWSAQDLPGSLVLTTSANAVVVKPGSLAYDTSKAAANHLVRELAMRLAPKIRVNAVAPATVLDGSAMFPRDRVIASLARYGLPCEEQEDTDTLRRRLADFYAERTLTRQAIRVEDQAEAVFLLASRRLGKTTGQILQVDGGLPEAFLR